MQAMIIEQKIVYYYLLSISIYYKNSSVDCHVYHWLIDGVIEIQMVCGSEVYVLIDLTYTFF